MEKPHHYHDCLTNEMLLKHFPSQFDLVKAAIQRAEYYVRSGKEMPNDENLAAYVLEELAETPEAA